MAVNWSDTRLNNSWIAVVLPMKVTYQEEIKEMSFDLRKAIRKRRKKTYTHLETLWWDVTDSGLDVVWNPFNKV